MSRQYGRRQILVSFQQFRFRRLSRPVQVGHDLIVLQRDGGYFKQSDQVPLQRSGRMLEASVEISNTLYQVVHCCWTGIQQNFQDLQLSLGQHATPGTA